MTDPVLSVENVYKVFPMTRGVLDRLRGQPPRAVHALNGVSLEVDRGKTLGIVGESGCGKSTLARCLVRLLDLDGGRIRFEGHDVSHLRGAERRAFNRRVQMIFQDPYSSLNPRMSVRQILSEAIRVHDMRPADQIPRRIDELLDLVRLPAGSADTATARILAAGSGSASASPAPCRWSRRCWSRTSWSRRSMSASRRRS